jgi:hypothetical protein
MMHKLLRIFLLAVLVMCVLNFIAFFLGALALGGDALSGYSEGGRYFLRSHGKATEVSADVFAYSKLHTRSIFITHPLAAIAYLFLWLTRK